MTTSTKDSFERLLTLTPDRRRKIIAKLDQPERVALMEWVDYRKANPWFAYEGNPVGFVEDVLGETIWTKQREILNSLRDNKRTTVSACHAPGKTFLAARAAAYWATVYPPGTTKIITTSTTFRQVKNVLWPHIRRLRDDHELPGRTTATEWKIGNELVSEGIKPPEGSEAALSGYHSPNMLIIVDEAGGIGPTFGRDLEALTTGMNTKMLILGNPPVDEDQTWFEGICNSPIYNHIEIPASSTPNFTGEETGQCKSCPPGVPPHPISTHLVDREWVDGLAREFGTESAFYMARVEAKFPKDNSSKALPISWLEAAQQNTDADTGNIRLGVDIAADGGDEFVISKADGQRVTLEYRSSGSDNENSVVVAGKIKEHIAEAEEAHAARGITEPVRVKIDSIGVGWGVVGILKKWKEEKQFRAEIIGVNVAEKARDSVKFQNQRAEMWWNLRTLIQPSQGDGEQELCLDVDTAALSQLNGPQYDTDSGGKIKIEKKGDMKKRGVSSPDRAEAMLLAVFEPPVKKKSKAAPLNLSQTNPWGAL